MSTESTKAPVAKTVEKNMDNRRVFSDLESAVAYLEHCTTEYSDFDSIPFVCPGMTDGEFDPAAYPEGYEIIVAKLNRQGTAKQREKGIASGGVVAIVMGAVPSVELLTSDTAGLDWLRGIIHKELNHVLVRPLREAVNVLSVVSEVPTTLTAFISSGREAGSSLLETFNTLYRRVNDVMSSKAPVWKRARLNKQELRRCLESKAYALETASALEDRGDNGDSLFVIALGLMLSGAKQKGLDSTLLERWMATRNETVIEVTADSDEDLDFDIDELAESLFADAPEEAAATEETPAAE
jgi:hypothetical protein